MAGGYWPRPWSGEDGGPRRWGCAPGLAGLGIGAGERLRVEAVAEAFATDVLLRRDPGELYALRHPIPLRGEQSAPVDGWVERLDPATLAVVASSPRLPAGSWWPGGLAAHRLLRRAFGLAGRSAALRRASVRLGHDRLAVLDLDSGVTKASVDVPSPVQGFLFPAPGFGRDIYYQSLTTICRVAVV